MSQFDKFATRYHKVKVGIQDMAMQDLAKETSKYEIEITALKKILTNLEMAKQKRSEIGLTSQELISWDIYVKRLEFESQTQHEKVAAVMEIVQEKRGVVKTAYTEQKKWSVIVEENHRKRKEIMRKVEQREADESATIRHGRSV